MLAAAHAALDALTQANIRARDPRTRGHDAGVQVQRLGDAWRAGENRDSDCAMLRREKRCSRGVTSRGLSRRARRRSQRLRWIRSAQCSARFRKISTCRAKTAEITANTRKLDEYAVFRKHMEGEGGGGFVEHLLVRKSSVRDESLRRYQGNLPRDPAHAGRGRGQMFGVRRIGNRARILR